MPHLTEYPTPGDLKSKMSTRMYVCESGEHSSSLLSGLNDQRLKGKLCDVTVRVQGHLFKAHSNILASSMGYFRDLFINSGKEKPTGIVEIPIIVNINGFAKILDFVYTSQLCLSQSTVMQVLCSACYLQIPYVVEKCQEFITTHGHVTPPSSLSEVTAPLLQGLQRSNFPKLNQNQPHNQSASASLSFLSQLNRFSEKSRTRFAQLQQIRDKATSSPQSQLEREEQQQECNLINTPPSPVDRALIGGESHRSSPNNSEEKNYSITQNENDVKRENHVIVASNDVKEATFTPHSNAERSLNSVIGTSLSKSLISNTPLAIEYTNRDGSQVDRDAIDHKTLADYFSGSDRDQRTTEHSSSFSFSLNGQQGKNGFDNSERQLIDLSKNGNSFLESSFGATPKKDRPKKEYRCDYCGKMFGRQQHLKRHILTHTGERPYPCQYCDKRFRRSEHLKHHVANHEQAMGIEPTVVPRKKAKKPVRTDAYTMSKMMLGQYAPVNGKNRSAIDYSNLTATPVILPSMFSGMERVTGSPRATLSEVGNASPSDNTDETNGQHQGSPASSAEHSPDIALNLCRDVKTEADENGLHDTPIPSDDVCRDSSEAKPANSNQYSPMSNTPVANGDAEIYEEEPKNEELVGMEGSEVLTPDLKRLMAAMNE